MGYKEDGRYYNWAAPGALISKEAIKYAKRDGSLVLSGGRITPYTMHREMVPASFLIPSKLGDDESGVILNFRTIDGKVDAWGDPYRWFYEKQGREATGSLSRIKNGHESWQLNIEAGSDAEAITINFDKAPKQIGEELFVFNVSEFRPTKK